MPPSICHLLYWRECGSISPKLSYLLSEYGAVFSENKLMVTNEIQEVRHITPNERSSYVIESSASGYAVTSHSNRCVSIINTGTMKKVCDIQGNNRTVWTIAIHPYDPALIATGNLGGHVSVFKNFARYSTDNNDHKIQDLRITSITFHPYLDIVCYAIQNQIVVWDWVENVRLAELNTNDGFKIKYAKFNPVNAMLITGIWYEPNEVFDYKFDCYANDKEELDETATYFMMHLFYTFALILDHIEFADSDLSLNECWSLCLKRIRLFSRSCVVAAGGSDKVIHIRSSPDAKINHIQDFSLTLAAFRAKAATIVDKIVDYKKKIQLIDDELDVTNELSDLRIIVQRYKDETTDIRNRSDIDMPLLESIFFSIHQIMTLHVNDVKHFENTRIFADFSRCQQKLQAWDFRPDNLPDLKQGWRNAITYSFILNDSTIDISRCGRIVCSFRELAAGPFQINVHSLEPLTFGQLLLTYQNSELTLIMSLSISPSMQYLLVGLRSEDTFGYFLHIGPAFTERRRGLTQTPRRKMATLVDRNCLDSNSISVLKWMARPGDGAIIGYRSFHLRCLISK